MIFFRPEIISDVSDDKFYTLKSCLDINTKLAYEMNERVHFTNCSVTQMGQLLTKANHTFNVLNVLYRVDTRTAKKINKLFEGYYLSCNVHSNYNKSNVYRNIIDNNIPCVIMHKVKNKWAPELDLIVCFMTGETNDVFLIHLNDLTEWSVNDV